VIEQLGREEASLVVDAARRAAQRFDWYADLLGGAGHAIEFERVPLLGEAELATTYYASGTDEGAEMVFLTSGTSTGARKRVRWTKLDHDRYVEQRADLFSVITGGSCRSACADLGTGHAAASAIEIFERMGLESFEIDVGWPVDRHVELLQEHRPDLLYTMPMILDRIIAAGGPGYAPRYVAVLGDLAPAAWRASVARRMGMSADRVIDVFGSIEVGAIAYSDDRAGGCVFHDHIVPELLPAPNAVGADAGLLALTSLARDGFPAVRYVSGDLVAGLRRRPVGGRLRWTYERHLGRIGDELKHGEMLSLHAVTEAIGELPALAWSVRRDGLEVVIEIDASSYSDELAERVRGGTRSE
jgi:fumarate---(S)-2,3-diaminopropanoate ligase